MIERYFANGKFVEERAQPHARIVAQCETREMATDIAFLLNWYEKVKDLAEREAEIKRLEESVKEST